PRNDRRNPMKKLMVSIVASMALAGMASVGAAELKKEITVEIQSTGSHADMAPGMYVCAEGRPHGADGERIAPLIAKGIGGASGEVSGRRAGHLCPSPLAAVFPVQEG